MKKQDAINDAQKKANLAKQPQVVFRYIVGPTVRYDYTHEHLWGRRQFKQPTVTHAITVNPVITDTT